MPYINPKDRGELDPLIRQLAAKIAVLAFIKGASAYAGVLNYVCTSLTLEVIKLVFGKVTYAVIATTSGVFSNIGSEFYRRVAVPYEDAKIEENGDLNLFAEINQEINPTDEKP